MGGGPDKRGAPTPFFAVEQDDPVDTLTPEFPIRLTTGRRLDSYNTGAQTEPDLPTPFRERLWPATIGGLSAAE